MNLDNFNLEDLDRASKIAEKIIKGCESKVLKAYRLGKEKYYTIGWGHSGPDVKSDMVITDEEAERLFVKDFNTTLNYVLASTEDVKYLNANMLMALVSLTFNIGIGDFNSSTLLKKLKASDYIGAALEFNKWRRSGGAILRGLEIRRVKEQNLFLSFVVDDDIVDNSSEPIIYTPDKNLNSV